MFTTTRLAYQSDNHALNSELYYNNVFELKNGRHPTIGEVYTNKMENDQLNNGSARCFFFAGRSGSDAGLSNRQGSIVYAERQTNGFAVVIQPVRLPR